jgi:GT2 family glycosyltransferase
LLVRTNIVRQVGMLDERFFMYYEETEFCARVRAHGYRIVLAPSAIMWHKVKPGDRPTSPVYLYLMARNRLLYLRCTGASAVTIATAVLATLRTVTSWVLRPRHQARRRFALVVVRAVIDFLRMSFGPPPASVVTPRRG